VFERLHLAAQQAGEFVPGEGERLVRNVEIVENVVEEVVFPVQKLVDFFQKRARFGAPDDPVIVGAGDGHHPADAKLAQQGVGLRREEFFTLTLEPTTISTIALIGQIAGDASVQRARLVRIHFDLPIRYLYGSHLRAAV
jgi:hypothetical protein